MVRDDSSRPTTGISSIDLIYRASEEIPIFDGSAGPLAKPDFLRTAVYPRMILRNERIFLIMLRDNFMNKITNYIEYRRHI